MDGSWQRKCHASHHGIVTAMSVDTGKCLDVHTLSNICSVCVIIGRRGERKNLRHMKSGKPNTNASLITQAVLEGEGSVRMLGRSGKRPGLKFTEYRGDGDSSSYKKVKESALWRGDSRYC